MKTILYTSEHFEACVNLFINVFNQAPWHDEWEIGNAKEYLTDFIHTPGFIGIMAMKDNEVIGFIFGNCKKWWSGKEYFIQEMCVNTDLQGSGIGTALLDSLAKTLKEQHIQRINLLTNRDVPANTFYNNKGFETLDNLIFLNKEL